jgi:predicted DNA-binding transcriptional regulator AlpA
MERTECLSEKLLARRWGFSHRTLERWRHDGTGPTYLKIGGRVVYRLSDIEAYEASRQRNAIVRASQVTGAPR